MNQSLQFGGTKFDDYPYAFSISICWRKYCSGGRRPVVHTGCRGDSDLDFWGKRNRAGNLSCQRQQSRLRHLHRIGDSRDHDCVVTCTNGTTYNVGLNAGTVTGATVTTRAMTGPASATLSYALYQDSGHATNWRNTVGTDTKSGIGNGSAQTLTVYGQLAASQYPTPGAYTDTITATITY